MIDFILRRFRILFKKENKENIVRYSKEELIAMRKRGESKTDWDRVLAKTEEELEADIASDPDWKDIPKDWVKYAKMVDPNYKSK